MYSFASLKDGYEHNWENLKIRPEAEAKARHAAERILQNKSIYQQVEDATGVPWYFIGLCHYRESNLRLDTYLGNGQPLSQRTTIVPKGRGPFLGPKAFVDGAVDALKLEHFAGATDWGPARTLYRLEGFNGYGYHRFGVNSPYLYSGSTVYGPTEAKAGKFVRDGVFDPNTVDPQLGVAVILKALIELDPSIQFGAGAQQPGPTAEPEDLRKETIAFVQESLNKLGADPALVVDGIDGRRTKNAISHFQQDCGLPDSGLLDTMTLAKITERASKATKPAPVVIPPAQQDDQLARVIEVLNAVILRLGELERNLVSATGSAPLQTDAVGSSERLQAVLQKATPKAAGSPAAPVSPDVDQLKKAISSLTAILGPAKDGTIGPARGGKPPQSTEEAPKLAKPGQVVISGPQPQQNNQFAVVVAVLDAVVQRLGDLERNVPSSASGAPLPTDPVALVERLLAVLQKATPQAATSSPGPVSPDVEQLNKAISLLNAIIGTAKDEKLPLGPVNGALGQTIGNLLDGYKTAIGVGGSLLNPCYRPFMWRRMRAGGRRFLGRSQVLPLDSDSSRCRFSWP
jgi:lysozyme family protein/peptidoglycan hydrolase-like protein with peptidoglycan-binding domain